MQLVSRAVRVQEILRAAASKIFVTTKPERANSFARVQGSKSFSHIFE